MHECPLHMDGPLYDPEKEHCNAWCDPAHGLHVDVWYERTAKPPTLAYYQGFHREDEGCEACTLLAIAPAPEAPPHVQRYTGNEDIAHPYAYRVTYRVDPPASTRERSPHA